MNNINKILTFHIYASLVLLILYSVTLPYFATSLTIQSQYTNYHPRKLGVLKHGRTLPVRNLYFPTALYAKKKAGKLVSDDLLTILEAEEAKPDITADGILSIDEDVKKNKKEKKLPTITGSEPTVDNALVNKKPNKKDKKGNKFGFDVDELAKVEENNETTKSEKETMLQLTESTTDATIDAAETVIEETSTVEITAEQRMRKERPPARVRFAESSQPDFVMMGLEQVGLVFGNNEVLKNASFSVATGERVGLVGQNGGGKTTQLRILAGEILPTTGDVVKSSKNVRIAFLRQEFIDELDVTRTLRDELRESFTEERKLLADIATCEDAIATTTDNPELMERTLNQLAKLQEEAISRGVYSLDSKVDKVMDSMGFSSQDQSASVGTFSGGWKMRIGLAKILLKDPNVLLLDEPTNHLDLDSVYWLEDFLNKQNIPMVIVSHDREFLDRVCNKIVEVEDGKTYTYQGNYSKYLDQRRARLDVWREQYEKQLKYIKEEENWIKKAKNDPSMVNQVRSREISLEKFKNSEEIIPQPPRNKKFRFRFPPAPRCGANIIETSKLSHGYENDVLFNDVNINIALGDRIGFVGPNGSGKSTLMRIMAAVEDPIKGFCDYGSNNVVVNYFEQNQADALDLDNTVVETIMESAPSDYTLTDIRALLGQFMFKGDDAEKKIRVLSGGEKARVALCKMMLSPANLLLLDEPTNHLDITSKEVLEEALLHYEGAVVVISHDRYFMSQVVNKIFQFRDKQVELFDMDYHDYMELQGEQFKEKVVNRYVDGDSYKITNAKPVVIEQKPTKTRNFGGSGVTSGNLNKGIKNAKRYN